MWWEILPSAGIVFTALLVPHLSYIALNKIFHNGKNVARNPYAPEFFNSDKVVYIRDERITGSRYIPQGLEAIPDEPCH
ncbi:unnamed protein product [Candidula unifasciata]|uniref:NADH dehydrogenase [ubiquinone] 1 alpha subcomplex subunit 1 n=1 Tax=Candidula unifasciata TaxID=100452 RepID=A0A8S3Z7B9_9EUPU|nr:unnamed protein product [Candidula unifasciata]